MVLITTNFPSIPSFIRRGSSGPSLFTRKRMTNEGVESLRRVSRGCSRTMRMNADSQQNLIREDPTNPRGSPANRFSGVRIVRGGSRTVHRGRHTTTKFSDIAGLVVLPALLIESVPIRKAVADLPPWEKAALH